MTNNTLAAILREIQAERVRQDEKWGEQNLPNGTGEGGDRTDAGVARAACDNAAAEGRCTYRLILAEEVAEAFAEKDPDNLREELVQVAAVAAAWIEKIDRDKAARPDCEDGGCDDCNACDRETARLEVELAEALATIRRMKLRHERGKPKEGWAELLFEIDGRDSDSRTEFGDRVRSRFATFRRPIIVAHIAELDGPEQSGNVSCNRAIGVLAGLLWAKLTGEGS